VQRATKAYTRIAALSQRDELILAHLSLVRHVIGKLIVEFPDGVDRENLEAAGTLGLVEAAGKFDPSRGTQFKTFAFARIRGAVLDELRRNCPLPQQTLQLIARVRKAHEELPPPVSLDALATAVGLSLEELEACLAAMQLTRMSYWDQAVEESATRLNDRQSQPDALAEQEEQKQILAQAIEALPERERLAVTLYYLEDLRLKEIGEALGLSESRVSRVLNAALFTLGEYIRFRER
jgi:RNA polymerase sigma factor FliA